MAADAPGEKRALRARIRGARHARTAEQRAAARTGVASSLTRLLDAERPGVVAAFLSTPEEPPTSGFLELCRDRGIRVIVPVCRADAQLDWAEMHPGTRLTTGRLGVPEPTEDTPRLSPAAVATADLLVVPAAAVDLAGRRLGWGLGFYDRVLERPARPAAHAVVFDDEVIARVPTEPHDARVDGIVTPTRIITCVRTIE